MTSFPFPVKELPKPTLRRVLHPADDDYVHFEHGQHLPFDATAAAFSPVNAWWLADAMLLAYWPEAEVERRFKSAGFAQVVPLIKKGTQCFVAIHRAFAVVSFRGTEPDSLRDILADVKLALKPWKVAGERVHDGFQDALEDVWQPLREALEPLHDRQVWFTGHSLGGALATLAADRHLIERERRAGGVYTFGSPLIGDGAFVDGFNRRNGERSFRFVNDRDSVTTVPPRLLGYRHVNHERFVGFDDRNVLNLAEPLIDHTPRRYAVLAWNSLVESTLSV